jgi:hypothetical protein
MKIEPPDKLGYLYYFSDSYVNRFSRKIRIKKRKDRIFNAWSLPQGSKMQGDILVYIIYIIRSNIKGPFLKWILPCISLRLLLQPVP